ncbi:MAG: amidohydrolase family protein [Dehalococcoidales bacterium]|jgi:predicted TIM-barrel fold metal-dependent hydrolase
MKLGRFVVDTHVHSQRHAAGKALKGSKDFADLGKAMYTVEAYDNSARLIYDMDNYGVDMCVIEPAFGMTNKTNAAQVEKYPQRFVANCNTKEYDDRCKETGEPWTLDGAIAEMARLLDTKKFVGVGEAMPVMPPATPENPYPDQETLIKNMMRMMDLARQYHIPVRYHAGTPGGYAIAYHAWPITYNPLWAHTLAVAYPDVPLILEHAGIEGGWWEWFYEQALHVAASHKNIYLETGRWWTELYSKALNDPSVGAEKLIWGTDWGASLPVYSQLNRYPPGYTRQDLKQGIPRHQVDIWGWSLKQIERLDINQDDMNLMLGGNAVRLYNLKLPGGLTRMFKFVDDAKPAAPGASGSPA